MKKIFNRKIFNFKKSKGTTIVEVLVSVIIIGVVSMYGLSFFSSSYRLATDSKDYNFILQDLIRKMEIAKGGSYQTDSSNFTTRYMTGRTYSYPLGIDNGTGYQSDRNHFDFKKNKNFKSDNYDKKLRNGFKIDYSYVAYENRYPVTGTAAEKFYGCTKIELTAEWPKGSIVRNRIKLVTYVADNWPRVMEE